MQNINKNMIHLSIFLFVYYVMILNYDDDFLFLMNRIMVLLVFLINKYKNQILGFRSSAILDQSVILSAWTVVFLRSGASTKCEEQKHLRSGTQDHITKREGCSRIAKNSQKKQKMLAFWMWFCVAKRAQSAIVAKQKHDRSGTQNHIQNTEAVVELETTTKSRRKTRRLF